MTMLTEEKALGTALIDNRMLDPLRILCYEEHRGLQPSDIESAETIIRAFLTAKRLVLSRVDRHPYYAGWGMDHPIQFEDRSIDPPFSDGLLDYEFEDPAKAYILPGLSDDETQLLSRGVKQMQAKALAELPCYPGDQYLAQAYVERWYLGLDLADESVRDHVEYLTTFGRESTPEFQNYTAHPLFHDGIAESATYLVGCHRAGYIIFSKSRLAEVCSEHIFSKWPDHLFRQFGEEFRRATAQARGPGIGRSLPPFLSLLLSRAERRHKIPKTLVDLREEYKNAREQLWNLLEEMWYAKSQLQQFRVLQRLEDAACSLFDATFPTKIPALDFAISLTEGAALSRLREFDQPKSRVAAISFTRKLSREMRKKLRPSDTLLRRHLNQSELLNFGLE